MALIQIHFFSEQLTECGTMNVILPIESVKREKYPVLWLIPPSGHDHTAWQRNTNIERLAGELGVMAVMPDMKLSFGLDMVHGFAYFSMLTKELPELIADYFPADLENQYIAGAEEGAYAALRAALLCPQNYRMAIGLSGGSLTDEILEPKRQAENAFGSADMGSFGETDYSLRHILKDKKIRFPKICLAYGAGDRYEKSAGLLAQEVEKRGDSIVRRRNRKLDWKEWAELLEKLLKEMMCPSV